MSEIVNFLTNPSDDAWILLAQAAAAFLAVQTIARGTWANLKTVRRRGGQALAWLARPSRVSRLEAELCRLRAELGESPPVPAPQPVVDATVTAGAVPHPLDGTLRRPACGSTGPTAPPYRT